MLIAKPFEEVLKQVSDLLKGRVLVGHALSNDLQVCARFNDVECPSRATACARFARRRVHFSLSSPDGFHSDA